MKKYCVIILFTMLLPTLMRAEIAPKIITIMQRSDALLDSETGVKMQMNVKVSMLVFSMNLSVTACSKGDKYYFLMYSSVLGNKIHSESGSDGSQTWTYRSIDGSDNKNDTLFLGVDNDDYSVDIGIYKDYNNAKMTLKKGVYEITLTEPKDADTPKKTIVKINADNYYPMELLTKDSGVTMKITIEQLSFDVPDDYFVLDLNKFPDAVVIRE